MPPVPVGFVGGSDYVGLGEHVIILNKQHVDHERMTSRGVKCSGGLIGDFSELADQLLEDGTHLGVADGFGDPVERAALGETVDLGVEVETLEDIADRWREGLDVGVEVFLDVVLNTHEGLHVHGRGVVEALFPYGGGGFGIDTGLLSGGVFCQYGFLGRLEDTIDATQDSEGKDDLAVLRLLVVTAEQIGDGSNKGGNADAFEVQGECNGVDDSPS
jgi:hypothetical protein